MFTLLQFHELFSKDARLAGKFFYTPGRFFTSYFLKNSNLVGGAAGSVTAEFFHYKVKEQPVSKITTGEQIGH